MFSLNIVGKQQESRRILKWSGMDSQAMRFELELVNWTIFFEDCVTCDDMWLKFKQFCHTLVDKYVPLVDTGTSVKNKLPFYIRKSLTKKRVAYKRRHLSPAHLERYKQLAYQCKTLIASNVLNQESKVLVSPGNRKFYQFVNKKLTSRCSISGITDENGVLLQNEQLVAEKFSSHYKSVFTRDNGRLIDVPVKCNVECSDMLLTRKTVYDSVPLLPCGFACGPDGLPAYFLSNWHYRFLSHYIIFSSSLSMLALFQLNGVQLLSSRRLKAKGVALTRWHIDPLV
jgi:hypothetical protein